MFLHGGARMRKILSCILVLTITLLLFCGCEKKKTKFTDYCFDYFDTVTSIVGYEKTQEDFNKKCIEIKKELETYHKLYDIYNRYEGINNLYTVNQLENGKHSEVKVDRKIIDLLTFSIEMGEKTSGKFNIAMGSLTSVWNEYRKAGESLPPIDLLQENSQHIDSKNIVINEEKNTVLLTDDKMVLDVGAVAKGYAAERIAQLMKEKGYNEYLLNIGGNVCTIGKAPDGKKWNIGIESPEQENNQNYIEQMKINGNMSLVTSGSYQRFYTVNEKNYHHIIDPSTLYPAEYFKSVSVLCESSALADVLSTTLFCLDYEQGTNLLKRFEKVEVMWVENDGTKLYTKGFKKYSVKS